MTPRSAHTRLRLRALGLYTLATLTFAVPHLATFIDPLAYAVGLALAVPVTFALIRLNLDTGERRWLAANWLAFAGRFTVYFTGIGAGTTLLLAYRHPAAWACGAVVLAGGAAWEWLRLTPPQAASPELGR